LFFCFFVDLLFCFITIYCNGNNNLYRSHYNILTKDRCCHNGSRQQQCRCPDSTLFDYLSDMKRDCLMIDNLLNEMVRRSGGALRAKELFSTVCAYKRAALILLHEVPDIRRQFSVYKPTFCSLYVQT
jgi:hypothetical protein